MSMPAAPIVWKASWKIGCAGRKPPKWIAAAQAIGTSHSTTAQTSKARLLGAAEQQQHHAHQRIKRDDIAHPQQQQMGDADQEQDDQPAQVAARAFAALLEPAELDREADSEQQREQRVELADDEPLDQQLGDIVELGEQQPAALRIGHEDEAGEDHHVGDEDAEQRPAAKRIEQCRALADADRAARRPAVLVHDDFPLADWRKPA